MDEMAGNNIQETGRSLLENREGSPPTIGVVGVSGTGKSATINALFKTNLAISHTGACTKRFEATEMKLMAREGVAKDEQATLVVVDSPGLGAMPRSLS